MIKLQRCLSETKFESELHLLSVFLKCVIKDEITRSLNIGAFLITQTHFVLVENLLEILTDLDTIPEIYAMQPINNLLELVSNVFQLFVYIF